MRYAWVGTLLFTGCAAFAAPGDGPDAIMNGPAPEPPPPSFGSGGSPAFTGTPNFQLPGADNVMPPITKSAVPPAPINGGTLLIAKDGHTALAADPDRDRVSIVDLSAQQVLATITLQPGDEPGRMAEDGAQRVHVVLRKTGEVATIDLATRSLQERRHVCQVPQGIAYDSDSDSLLVACTEGDLVTLPARGGEVSARQFVATDLRDVVLSQGHRYVTRFKNAELIDLNSDAFAPRTIPHTIRSPFIGSFGLNGASFDATVAWRSLALPDGRVMMLHERAQSTPIALSQEDPHAGASDPSSGSGAAGGGALELPGGGGSPYGGGSDCDAIVRPALSMSGGPGTPLQSGPVIPSATLAVDAALSSDGHWLAIGVAGSRNARSMLGQIGAMVFDTNQLTMTGDADATGTCQTPGNDIDGGVIAAGQVVGVAFDGEDHLVMQTREPNTLVIKTKLDSCTDCGDRVTIELGGEPRLDSGQDLFHQDAGAGLACASCHPAGGDDGHTWVFDTVGKRRTQLFNMGIRDTVPLHWDGEFATFNQLVDEVFSRRMGGAHLDQAHVGALADWIETLSPNARMRSADDESALRGKALFESAEVGCSGCHNGAKLTNNTTVDVGTGGAFQVPSLVGVAYHQPYLHTGCAATLRERFNPDCGGDKHGHTADLNDAQIDDLVAFLQTL